ncbi:TraR/DksA family transcriptional regulator [Pseudomonas citrulli]|jgi:phage/conjugal plasmid C-4 type zinc finger TraR family protein|uniref:TraR/DksA family transcriptional regulator n=1 Tax=Pseudomonas citrulli TaxID=3064347 RepID=UPI003ACDD2C5
MGDIADFANDLVQESLDQALAARNAAKSPFVTHSLLLCEACDDPIPEARRIAQPGCTLCIDCKNLDDLRRARYAR